MASAGPARPTFILASRSRHRLRPKVASAPSATTPISLAISPPKTGRSRGRPARRGLLCDGGGPVGAAAGASETRPAVARSTGLTDGGHRDRSGIGTRRSSTSTSRPGTSKRPAALSDQAEPRTCRATGSTTWRGIGALPSITTKGEPRSPSRSIYQRRSSGSPESRTNAPSTLLCRTGVRSVSRGAPGRTVRINRPFSCSRSTHDPPRRRHLLPRRSRLRNAAGPGLGNGGRNRRVRSRTARTRLLGEPGAG
jgi:hypothetical protein